MSYQHHSKHNKNASSPKESSEHCCHTSSDSGSHPLKKHPLSTDKPSGEYTYNSPYASSNSENNEDYCLHGEDLDHECQHLKDLKARQERQKAIDFIRKKLQEEDQRNS